MNRCKISLGVLIALVILCITALFTVRAECSRFSDQVVAVTDSLESGDTETILTEFDTLQEQWERFHNVTGIFIDGSKLDPMKEILFGLRPMLETGYPEAASELERLRSLVEGIFEEEFPEYWHIL